MDRASIPLLILDVLFLQLDAQLALQALGSRIHRRPRLTTPSKFSMLGYSKGSLQGLGMANRTLDQTSPILKSWYHEYRQDRCAVDINGVVKVFRCC